MLVVRHGVLVFEHYYHGATPATSFNVFSVTKSLTSALAGIALGEHALGGLQQPIGRLLATHLPPNPDPRLRRATLEQVLTMTAGLPAVSADGSPPSLVHASDWVRFVLSQHPLATPGGRSPTPATARTCCRRSPTSGPASPGPPTRRATSWATGS